ncbi:MAG: hypothetical protein KatS3mg082_2248 [Nitrospiraceae bacterium]|nr:MAG: hypothetical protein KatS3mg082_2248 [Nitrospiraceae bacterium]
MTHPALLPLEACEDRALAGGKAAGLHRLILHGFRVPSGICLTTALYEEALERTGIHLHDRWRMLQTLSDRNRPACWPPAGRAIEQPILLQPIFERLGRVAGRTGKEEPGRRGPALGGTVVGLARGCGGEIVRRYLSNDARCDPGCDPGRCALLLGFPVDRDGLRLLQPLGSGSRPAEDGGDHSAASLSYRLRRRVLPGCGAGSNGPRGGQRRLWFGRLARWPVRSFRTTM